jgi:hypothetical protein
MTALTIATDIPSGITTVEQLNVWTSHVLSNLNSNLDATEGLNYSVRASQSGIFYIAATDKYQHIGRQSIEVAPDHLIGGAKPWTFAKELSQKPLTAAMKSN